MNKRMLNQLAAMALIVIGILSMSGCASMMRGLASDSFVANAVTKPGSSPVKRNPKEFGLEYEDVTFKANDGVMLSGWLIKGNSDKVIILTHFGIQCSRSGYTPEGKGLFKAYGEEIEFLRIAKHLTQEGYNVLMYDLRNHGRSGKGTCEWITGGVEEYKDIIAAVDFITTHEDYKDSPIGLLSYCMGACSTTYAYGIAGGLQEYDNIRALVAVQPLGYVDFLKGFGFSEGKIEDANEVNLKRGGVDLYKTPIAQVKNITVPTMLVQGEKDPWANMDWINEFYSELQVKKEMYWLEGAEHRFNAYEWFIHSPEKMLEFFNKYL